MPFNGMCIENLDDITILRMSCTTGEGGFLETPDFGAVSHLPTDALLRHPDMIRTVIDHATTALLMTDMDGQCVYMNPAAEAMTGFQFSELRGRSVHQMLHYKHPDGSPYPAENCPINKAVYAGEYARDQEEILIHKDKTFYSVQYSITPVFDGKENLIGALHEIRDITSEKKAFAELRESERRFEEVVNDASLLFAVWDQYARLAFISKPWLDYTGMSLEHALKVGFLEHFHPDNREKVVHEWRNAFVRKKRFSGEYLIQRADGEYRWFYLIATPRYSPEGRFAGFYATALDIHDRKQVELALNISESRFRRLYDANVLGVMFWDLRGVILQANDAFLEMLGYGRDQFQQDGLNWRQITPQEYWHLDIDAIDQLMVTGLARPFEKQYFHRNGQRIDVLVYVTFLDEARFQGVAFVLDITSRKGTERALQESETKFRQISESGLLGLFFCEIDGSIYEANETACRMLGYTPAEIDVGLAHWDKITPPELLDEDLTRIHILLERGSAKPYEKQLLRKDGTRLDVLIGYAFLPGTLEKMVCFMVDVTEQKQAESQLQESEARFRRLYDSGILGVVFTDGVGKALEANTEACRILGVRQEDISAGLVYREAITVAEYHTLDLFHLDEAKRTGSCTPYEKQYVHVDGTKVDALVGYATLPGSDNLVCFILDITGRKNMERQLLHDEENFRMLADRSPVMMWTANEHGKVNFVNKTWIEFTGISGGGDLWKEAFQAEDAEQMEQIFQEAYIKKQAYSFEGQLRYKKPGQYHWTTLTGVPHFRQNGEFAGFIGTIVDVDERKELELSLRESEKRFKNIAETAPVLIWISEPNGYCTYANQAWQTFTGLTTEEILGFHWLKLIHPKDRKKYMGSCAEASLNPKPFQKELRLKHHDGHYRWVLMSAMPRMSENQFLGYIGTISDIHERKEGEIALQKSEEYFRQIADASSVLLWMIDENGDAIFVSQGLADFVGRSKEELMGLQWQASLPPDTQQEVLAEFWQHVEQRHPFSIETRAKHRDDTFHWVLVSGQPQYDYDGVFKGFIGTLIDITERKDEELERRKSDAYFREVMEASPVNLWISDTNGSVIFVNKTLTDYFHVSTDELEGAQWLKRVHPEDRNLRANLEKYFNKQEPYTIEFRFSPNNDECYLWLLSTARPRYLSSGEFAGYIGTLVDITTRKETEIELRKSQEYFRHIADTSPVMLWMTTADGGNEFVSEGLAEFFGLAKKDFLGAGWMEAFHPDDRGPLREQFMKALLSHGAYTMEARALTKSGEYRWILDSGRPRFDRNGQFIGLIGTVTDIHDRKEAMLAIERSEAYFRNISDQSPVMLWIAEPDGSISFVSQGFADYFGRDKQDFSGNFWLNCLHPDDREPFIQYYKEHSDLQEAYTAEYRVFGKDGSIRWVLDFGQPRFNLAGQFIGFIGTLTDITDRKQAMLAIERSEEYFRHIVDVAPVLLWMSEPEGTLTFVSKNLCTYFGYKEEELLGSEWLNALHPDDVEIFSQYYLEHIKNREPYTTEFRVHRNGEYRWVLAFGQPRFNLDGEYVGFIGTVTDITTKKEAEIAIRESESRFRSIMDAAPVKLWMTDLQGNVIYTSKGLMDFLGLEAEDLTKGMEAFRRVAHPDDVDAFLIERQQHIEKQEPYAAELRICNWEKEYRWVLSTAQPRYSGEQFVGYIGSVVDITEKKEAEIAIRESEAYFRMITDMAPVMLWVADEDGKIRYFSKRLLDFIGGDNLLNADDIAFKEGFQNVFHPDDITLFLEVRNRNFAKREAYRVEARIRNQEGEYRWALLSAVPRFSTATGKFEGYIGSIIDITERKQSELALQESESRFRLMADAAPVYIWLSNKDGQVEYFNRQLLDFLGITLKEAQAGQYLDCIHPDDREGLYTAGIDPDGNPEPFHSELRMYSFSLKEYRWIYNDAVPRFTPDGAFLGFAGSSIDITDFKRAQSEIQSYAKRLEQSNRELEEFATIASHDLQAPLRKISLFSTYIQENAYDILSNESKDHFDRILKSVDKMQCLLTDLLDLSRVNRKGQPFRPISLNDIIEEVLSDLQFLMNETQGKVNVDLLCTVDADPLQMHQLFQNLIGNALKFHRPGVVPEINIYTEKSGNLYCCIIVEDNGIGFEKDQADRIFEPFVRLHGAENYEGTGMGLTICRKIVERHGGSITANSQPGVGTRFAILLPLPTGY